MEKYNSKLTLDGNWKLFIAENKDCQSFAPEMTCADDLAKKGISAITGTVPGNFELDMMREGLIPDLFYDVNTLKAQKLENRHLWYCTTFNFDGEAADEPYFIFEGVDTYADYYLNGEYIGSSDNMLIEHEFSAWSIKKGENELLVHITPTMIAARDVKYEAGIITCQTITTGAVAVRKAAHMYGWDIMPRIISGGIWKSVHLVTEKKDAILELYMYTRNQSDVADPANQWMYISTKLSGDFCHDYKVRIKGICGDSEFDFTRKLWHSQDLIPIHIPNVKLWWPKHMGEQNLYKLTVELVKDGEVLDTKTFNHGVRKVKLVRSDYVDYDGKGEFKFVINGKDMFAMGTNWVPLDAFHSRDKERLPKALELLGESGSNIVRCWGGNVYENDEFFDYCDKEGIVIWQDFAMGCSWYPQDADFHERMRVEATKVIKRLRQHPSLIMWAGDNEVDVAIAHVLDPKMNYITREVLPRTVELLDPARTYLPSSPYCSTKAVEDKMTHRISEDHLWGPRHYYKQDYYKKSVARFASETGFHGCNSPEGIKKFIAPENLWANRNFVNICATAPSIHRIDYNKAWQIHAACMEDRVGADFSYRIPLMGFQVDKMFGDSVPDTLEDFALASQVFQSEGFKYMIEMFRANKGERSGIIWWNLLDGWPQFSDAVVDYNYVKKMAYFTIRRIQKSVMFMFRDPSKTAGKLELIAANDTMVEKYASYKVTDIETGDVILEGEGQIPPLSSFKIAQIPEIKKQGLLLIEFTVDGKTYKNHYLTGDIKYDYKQVVEWFKKADLLEIEGF